MRPEERRRAEVRAVLKEQRSALLLLAQMIAGRPLLIFESANPWLCDQERLFLPREFSLARTREGNLRFYELKAVLGALAIREGWSANGDPLAVSVDRCQAELPYLRERLDALQRELPERADLWAHLGQLPGRSDGSEASAGAKLPTPADPAPNHEATAEIDGQGQSQVTVLPPQEDDGPGADLPLHTFEKVETLEEYSGNSRKSDDEDELAKHEEALQELNLSQVIRSPERPRSIYRSELILDGAGFESSELGPATGWPYPEWDYRKGQYRPDWCFVQAHRVGLTEPDWASTTRRRHGRLWQQLKRQFVKWMAS